MKFGLPISLALHGGVLLVSMVGFGFKAKAAPQVRVIPVKILTVAIETNVRPAQKAPQPKPVVEPEQAAPVISEPEQEPEVKAEAAPLPEAKAETAPVTQPVKAPVKPAPPKPLSLDDLSALVKQSRKSKPDAGEQKMLESERARIELADASRAGAGQGTGLTTAYEDAIMRRVYNAWRIPSGAPNLESLVVGLDVILDRDGKVVSVRLNSDSARQAAGNAYFKIAAESAVRAVQDAAQFKFLPRNEYERWRSLSLTFFPKDAPNSASSGVPT